MVILRRGREKPRAAVPRLVWTTQEIASGAFGSAGSSGHNFCTYSRVCTHRPQQPKQKQTKKKLPSVLCHPGSLPGAGGWEGSYIKSHHLPSRTVARGGQGTHTEKTTLASLLQRKPPQTTFPQGTGPTAQLYWMGKIARVWMIPDKVSKHSNLEPTKPSGSCTSSPNCSGGSDAP